MISSKALSKEYSQFTVKERALLIIKANMNSDDQEFERLNLSSSLTQFEVQGFSENIITSIFHLLHKDFVLFKSHFYRTILSAIRASEISLYYESFFLESAVLDLAFVDTLNAHDFPIDYSFLEAFDLKVSIEWDRPENVDEIKQSDLYKGYLEVFMKSCEALPG